MADAVARKLLVYGVPLVNLRRFLDQTLGPAAPANQPHPQVGTAHVGAGDGLRRVSPTTGEIPAVAPTGGSAAR